MADLGAKSPLTDVASLQRVCRTHLPPVPSDTVRVEVTTYRQLWQTPLRPPERYCCQLSPEAAPLLAAVFFSTRSGAGGGSARLRITYMRAFPFENP